MLYGEKSEHFEELIIKNDEEGNVIFEPTIVKSLVHEKIFLDLQQDEIEFTNESFKLHYTIKLFQNFKRMGNLF